jgi:hypothetical protein
MVQQHLITPFRSGDHTVALAGNDHERPCTVDLWRKFQPRRDLPFLNLRRLKVLAQASRSFPPHRELHFAHRAGRKWAIYFCYARNGIPTASHRFTVDRLRDEGFAVLCVCATPEPEQAKAFMRLGPDGLIWKALRGYDFSGYSVGLQALAQRYDGIDVLVMNDSILGPLHPLGPCLDSTPWDLTGFMTSHSVEHHIQSFAFYIKQFGPQSYRALRKVFFRNISFNSQGPVSFLQETRLGSALTKSMSIGSIMSPSAEFKGHYYLLGNPKGLLDAGFPFLKQSIFTKFADGFDQRFYRDCLDAYGHPDIADPA